MKIKDYRWFILFILTALLNNVRISAQENPSQNEFLIGAFISNSENFKYTFYNNYDQVSDLGVNSVFQRAIREIPGKQASNFTQLSLFPFVYAANDSGTGTGNDTIDARYWQNVDWISYFTQAKYRKWEAEGDDPLFSGNVKVKHDFGTEDSASGISFWRSGTDPNDINKFLVKGPDYWQYPRYTFTNPSWNPAAIQYKVVFRMKIDQPSDPELPVCRIMATNTDSDGVETVLTFNGISCVKTVYANEFVGTNYKGFEIEYDYKDYYSDSPPNENYPSMPGSIERSSGYGYNLGSKVQFKVQWLGNAQLYVDRIEVYDELIWEGKFIDHPDQLIDTIVTYNQAFSNLGSNLKYYYTMDEPHSIDCYEPLRKVQEIMDGNNINAKLLTHFYPEYNGRRDGDPYGDLLIPQYSALAQPKKLYFWYAPFTTADHINPESVDYNMANFRNILQQAYEEQPGFYLAGP